MLSSRCRQRNETIIPSLLSQHEAVLTGSVETIDLSTAENWAVKQKVLQEFPNGQFQLSDSNLAYSSGVGGCSKTRDLLAQLLNGDFRPAKLVEPSHVILGAGGSFALTALIEQICDPGDGVLIATPYWAGLDISINVHAHGQIVPVHIPLEEHFNVTSVSYYESTMRSSTIPIKAVLMCNPHNPLGRCYPRETILSILEFCRENNLHYISDEVYALSAHRPYPDGLTSFISVLEIDHIPMRDSMHVIYSMSKDFGCNGIRLGAIISQSNTAVSLSAALCLHSQVSALSTAFATQLLSNQESMRSITGYGGGFLKAGYDILRKFLDDRKMKYVPVGYGMFVFARLLELQGKEEEQKLLGHFKSAGISISTGTSYHFLEPGWFRICFGVSRVELERGLERLDIGIQNYLQTV